MARRLVMIVGAHALGDTTQAYAWALRHLQVLIQDLARYDAHVITGGEPGPEVWAASEARAFGVPYTAYFRDGSREHNLKPAGRWTGEPTPHGAAAVSRRDRFLVEQVAAARLRGDDVEIVAFTEAGANERSSSHRRTMHALGSGLPVQQYIWGEVAAATKEAAA